MYFPNVYFLKSIKTEHRNDSKKSYAFIQYPSSTVHFPLIFHQEEYLLFMCCVLPGRLSLMIALENQ